MADNIYRGLLVYGDASQPIPVTALAGGVATTPPAPAAYTDRSIANLTGASQQLMAANAARRALGIQNVAVNPVGVNLSGGTAAIGVGGTFTLAPGATVWIDSNPPANAITAIGTLNDDLTAWEC